MAGVLLGFVVLQVGRHAPLYDSLAPRRIEREAPAGGRRAAPRRVVLVSVDGLAPRVVASSETPTLDRWAEQGAAALDARTVVPSITMTAHATMLTGVGPDAHGVRWNRYQPWSRIPGPTLFGRCAAAGMRCALVAGKTKFARFAEEEPGVHFYALGETAEGVLEAGADWMERADGDFLMVHLAEVDLAGHAHGWDGEVQRAAVTNLDALLGAFRERLRTGPRPLLLLLTSDHGGHGTTHGSASDDDVLVPWVLVGDGVAPGASLGAAPHAIDVAPTVLTALGVAVPDAWRGKARFPVR